MSGCIISKVLFGAHSWSFYFPKVLHEAIQHIIIPVFTVVHFLYRTNMVTCMLLVLTTERHWSPGAESTMSLEVKERKNNNVLQRKTSGESCKVTNTLNHPLKLFSLSFCWCSWVLEYFHEERESERETEREKEGRRLRLQPASLLLSTQLLLRRWDADPREERFMPRTAACTTWPTAPVRCEQGKRLEKLQPGEVLCSPRLRWSWCFLLSPGWCHSAGAGRSCSAWNWACWWPCWWPAAAGRSRTAGRPGRPATGDLICTLFWTSEWCYFCFWCRTHPRLFGGKTFWIIRRDTNGPLAWNKDTGSVIRSGGFSWLKIRPLLKKNVNLQWFLLGDYLTEK